MTAKDRLRIEGYKQQLEALGYSVRVDPYASKTPFARFHFRNRIELWHLEKRVASPRFYKWAQALKWAQDEAKREAEGDWLIR